jgi:MFS family permease
VSNTSMIHRISARLPMTLAAQSAEQVGLAASPTVAAVALGANLASILVGILANRMSRTGQLAHPEALRILSLVATVGGLMLIGALTLPLLASLIFIAACGTVAYGIAPPALALSRIQGNVARRLTRVARGHRRAFTTLNVE